MNLAVKEGHGICVKEVLTHLDVALFDFLDCSHRHKYDSDGASPQAFASYPQGYPKRYALALHFCPNPNGERLDRGDMKITTHLNSSGGTNETWFVVDCDSSTAVSDVTIHPNLDDNSFVRVTYKSGDKWGYMIPTSVLLLGLSEQSVGRFVATFVKPNAEFPCHLNKEAVSV